MAFNFVCDQRINGRAYPALAKWSAQPYTKEWQEFVHHWPYTVPCELIEHCQAHDFPYHLWTVDESYPSGSYYMIGLGFFSFDIDYFALMSLQVLTALKDKRLRAVFYYHEGDNPFKIQQRLNDLCRINSLPVDSYRFISGNSSAEMIDNFFYFPDHELLYWRRNLQQPALPINDQPRKKDFTVLSRTHKWWRAAIVSDLKRNGLLDNSYWSYNTDVTLNETLDTNPIETDQLNLTAYMQNFVAQAPYRCDDLTSDQHNDHALLVPEHYNDATCNIILETLFDAEQSGGAFLTEKTFKVLKHAQPFVVAGPAGTINALTSLGYRVFKHVIDHTYDLEPNPTERWRLLYREIARIRTLNPIDFFDQCRADIQHNQQLFVRSKYRRLNMLFLKLINS